MSHTHGLSVTIEPRNADHIRICGPSRLDEGGPATMVRFAGGTTYEVLADDGRLCLVGAERVTFTDPTEARRRLTAAAPDPIEVAKAQGTAFAEELLRDGRLGTALRMALSSVVGDALDRVAPRRGEAVVALAEAVGRGMRGGGA